MAKYIGQKSNEVKNLMVKDNKCLKKTSLKSIT